MNILTDQLPDAIRVNERIYEVNSDFRDCLRIILAFEDNELVPIEKQMVLVDNLYKEPVAAEDYGEAIRKGVRFLDGGGQADDDEDGESGPRVYSFGKDANLIFAAFQQTHGIDLQNTEYMHWWHFLTLFMDLGENTVFCSLVGLRKRVKTGKATKAERDLSEEMGAIFEVPELDTRSLAEKVIERDFMAQVAEGQQRKKEQKKELNDDTRV